MWCPRTDAKVYGWIDKSGAAHRQITLRPQKGMTSTMYQWFITTTVMGLMPPIVEFQGNVSAMCHLEQQLRLADTVSQSQHACFIEQGTDAAGNQQITAGC